MNARSRIDAEIKRLQDDPGYELEVLLLEMNRQISALMDRQGLRKVDVADRLGTSRAFVTQVLRGETNVTLKTLVRVANALEMKVGLQLRPREAAAKRRRPASKRRVAAAAASRAPATKRAAGTTARAGPRTSKPKTPARARPAAVRSRGVTTKR